MSDPFKEFFAFTRFERRGILVLLFLIAVLLLINILLPFYLDHQPTDFSEFAKEIETFERQFHTDTTSKKIISQPKNASTNFGHASNMTSFSEGQKDDITQLTPSRFEAKSNFSAKKDYVAKKLCVDINTADTTEIKRLPYIGSAFAKRIVKYRDMLGGFYQKEQLLEVYGMDTMRYRAIEENVCVSDSFIKKMKINEATAKELARHPYIDWKVAHAIVNHRFKKPFESIEQLREVYLVNDSLFRKIVPYFTIE